MAWTWPTEVVLLRDLVAVPSVSGTEETLGRFVEETARDWGLGAARADDGVLVTVDSGRPGPKEGKVDLDAPIRKYIKDFKLSEENVARKVTVRHLLTHMGGWVGDYFNEFGNGEDALDRMVKDIAKLPQIRPLGTIWSYNNTGFNVASRIIEVVTEIL